MTVVTGTDAITTRFGWGGTSGVTFTKVHRCVCGSECMCYDRVDEECGEDMQRQAEVFKGLSFWRKFTRNLRGDDSGSRFVVRFSVDCWQGRVVLALPWLELRGGVSYLTFTLLAWQFRWSWPWERKPYVGWLRNL